MRYTLRTRRPKLEVKCETCGKLFLKHQCSIHKHIYCSVECRYKQKQPNSKMLVACSYCSKPIALWPYRLKESKVHFCNNRCKGKWQSLHLIAEKSANWKGGSYSTIANTLCNTRYRRIRKTVVARDNVCQLCGGIERLEVHHIIEKGKNPALIYDVTNMITLCKKCHCCIRGKEEDYIGYFNDIVEKRANSVEPRTGNTEPSISIAEPLICFENGVEVRHNFNIDIVF